MGVVLPIKDGHKQSGSLQQFFLFFFMKNWSSFIRGMIQLTFIFKRNWNVIRKRKKNIFNVRVASIQGCISTACTHSAHMYTVTVYINKFV